MQFREAFEGGKDGIESNEAAKVLVRAAYNKVLPWRCSPSFGLLPPPMTSSQFRVDRPIFSYIAWFVVHIRQHSSRTEPGLTKFVRGPISSRSGRDWVKSRWSSYAGVDGEDGSCQGCQGCCQSGGGTPRRGG